MAHGPIRDLFSLVFTTTFALTAAAAASSTTAMASMFTLVSATSSSTTSSSTTTTTAAAAAAAALTAWLEGWHVAHTPRLVGSPAAVRHRPNSHVLYRGVERAQATSHTLGAHRVHELRPGRENRLEHVSCRRH